MLHQQYIFQQDGQPQGPFDLLGILKKIRNKALTRTTLVSVAGSPFQAAEAYPELLEVFNDLEYTAEVDFVAPSSYHLDLVHVMKEGFFFLKIHQLSAAFAGLVAALCVLVGILFANIPAGGQIIAGVIYALMFSLYLLYVLRVFRGQQASTGYLISKLRQNALGILGYSALLSLPFSIALALTIGISPFFMLLTLAGLLVISVFIFTPLLILDQNLSLGKALHQSKHMVMSLSWDARGVLLALVVINFVAAITFVLLFLSLPITFAAISQIYDDLFSR